MVSTPGLDVLDPVLVSGASRQHNLLCAQPLAEEFLVGTDPASHVLHRAYRLGGDQPGGVEPG